MGNSADFCLQEFLSPLRTLIRRLKKQQVIQNITWVIIIQFCLCQFLTNSVFGHTVGVWFRMIELAVSVWVFFVLFQTGNHAIAVSIVYFMGNSDDFWMQEFHSLQFSWFLFARVSLAVKNSNSKVKKNQQVIQNITWVIIIQFCSYQFLTNSVFNHAVGVWFRTIELAVSICVFFVLFQAGNHAIVYFMGNSADFWLQEFHSLVSNLTPICSVIIRPWCLWQTANGKYNFWF